MPNPVILEREPLFVLRNGIVQISIDQNGILRKLISYGGPNLVSSGPHLTNGGYWNFNGNGYNPDGTPIPQKFSVLTGEPKVLHESDDLIEIAFIRQPIEPMFFKTSLHYVLRRGEPGFHLYMTVTHDETMPPGHITQYAYNLRLSPKYFDYIAVDDFRRHISHSCFDEEEGEMIMDATFRLADGNIVSKYNYCHAIEDSDDFQLYGWAGPKTGVWWIQASGEYYSSAPFRVLLTSHQTSKSPVIIWQTQCTHRGGYQIEFLPGDNSPWKKLYGPVFVYLNSGEDYNALWNNAKEKVEVAKSRWPYQWMSHELFDLKRSNVIGTIEFDGNVPVANAIIILAPEGSHWSKENRGYHFWSKTDKKGNFSIEKVRSGRYTLFAIGADQFYEFKQDGILIIADEEKDLGKIIWERTLHGKRIWQIGIADRSTGEFANGDDFHHWGLWRRYPTDFPEDVDFEIGKSRENQDWNFAHWNWFSKTNSWNIRFKMDEERKGTVVLTFGIAAARAPRLSDQGNGDRSQKPNSPDKVDIQICLNNKELGSFGAETTGSVSYRSARQSTRYSVKEIRFDADLLHQGENLISLRHKVSEQYSHGEKKGESGSGPGCIMYDAIRMEIG